MIKVPIYLVGGHYDKVCPESPNIDHLKLWASIGEDRVYSLKTGHIIMLESPHEVQLIIDRMIHEHQI